MPIGEIEIERLATAMITRHGAQAARAAVARLNQSIDRRDWAGRERWACVVRLIHQRQGFASVTAGVARDTASRLSPAA
jgi:hypothetical protein